MTNFNGNCEIDYNKVGERLRRVRGAVSQTAFGKPVGYKYGYVKDCEHGKKPSLEYLFKISSYYDVSLDWVIKGIEPIGSKNAIGSAQLTANGADPELEEMYAVLKQLMQNPDPNLRGWTIIQFKKAFGDYCIRE